MVIFLYKYIIILIHLQYLHYINVITCFIVQFILNDQYNFILMKKISRNYYQIHTKVHFTQVTICVTTEKIQRCHKMYAVFTCTPQFIISTTTGYSKNIYVIT